VQEAGKMNGNIIIRKGMNHFQGLLIVISLQKSYGFIFLQAAAVPLALFLLMPSSIMFLILCYNNFTNLWFGQSRSRFAYWFFAVHLRSKRPAPGRPIICFFIKHKNYNHNGISY